MFNQEPRGLFLAVQKWETNKTWHGSSTPRACFVFCCSSHLFGTWALALAFLYCIVVIIIIYFKHFRPSYDTIIMSFIPQVNCAKCFHIKLERRETQSFPQYFISFHGFLSLSLFLSQSSSFLRPNSCATGLSYVYVVIVSVLSVWLWWNCTPQMGAATDPIKLATSPSATSKCNVGKFQMRCWKKKQLMRSFLIFTKSCSNSNNNYSNNNKKNNNYSHYGDGIHDNMSSHCARDSCKNENKTRWKTETSFEAAEKKETKRAHSERARE